MADAFDVWMQKNRLSSFTGAYSIVCVSLQVWCTSGISPLCLCWLCEQETISSVMYSTLFIADDRMYVCYIVVVFADIDNCCSV